MASHILSGSPCTRICTFISPSRLFSRPFGRCLRPLFPPSPFLFDLIAPFYAPRTRIYARLRSTISHTGLMLMHARICAQRRRSFDSLLCLARCENILAKKRKKFIRAIKNALRDFIRLREGCRREYRKIMPWIETRFIEFIISICFISHLWCVQYCAMC